MHARTISRRCTGVMCTGVFRCSSVMTPSLFAKSDSKKRLATATLTAPVAPPIRKNQPEDSVTQSVYLSGISHVFARTKFEHECLQNGVFGNLGLTSPAVSKRVSFGTIRAAAKNAGLGVPNVGPAAEFRLRRTEGIEAGCPASDRRRHRAPCSVPHRTRRRHSDASPIRSAVRDAAAPTAPCGACSR